MAIPGKVVDEVERGPAACWQDEARRIARGIRRRVLEHVIRNKGGYLSQACSAAEILATLYMKVLKLGRIEPLLPGPFSGVPGPDNRGLSPGTAFHGPAGSALRPIHPLALAVRTDSLRSPGRGRPHGPGGLAGLQSRRRHGRDDRGRTLAWP